MLMKFANMSDKTRSRRHELKSLNEEELMRTPTNNYSDTRADADRPSKRLRGLFKMPTDFDYKEALRNALKEKYEL